MRVAEAAKRQGCIDTEGLARGLQLGTWLARAIIGEADEALVEACGTSGASCSRARAAFV